MNTEKEESRSEVATSPARAAYVKVEPQARALKLEELVPLVVNLAEATRTGLDTASRIEFLLPAIEEMPRVDVELIRDLRTYARACRYAHLAWPNPERFDRSAPEQEERLRPKASKLRLLMVGCAELLVELEQADAEVVAQIRGGGRSSAELADNLMQLAVLFEELPAEVRAKLPIDEDHIARAHAYSERLRSGGTSAESSGETGVDGKWSRGEARHRMWTLFHRAYTETRRVVSFLRWYEGDVDELVPKLSNKLRRRDDEAEVEQAPAEPAATPSPTDTTA